MLQILRIDPREGMLLGVPASMVDPKASGLVGAYVPLARVATAAARGVDVSSTDKTAPKWRIEKNFKVDDPIRCRIVAANLLEGNSRYTVGSLWRTRQVV